MLVTRADWDPLPEPIPAPEAQFIGALATTSLGAAAEVAPGLDLANALSRLIARKAIVNLEVPQ